MIYETHVKGLTKLHPEVPESQRGTYAGLAHPAVIDHLTRLGATAVELMPVHQFVQDSTLQDKGLSNYWGYNTIGFFAPHNAYSAFGDRGQQVQEFKAMVKALHAAGIEVILDVVYNHTAEGNHFGPTISFRGIDNAAYYRLVEDDQQYYMDYTGTGNSFNVRHPHSLQLIMDSLRYWVTEMHVDGFRFDLAATLAREFYEVDRLSTFFELVQQDPIVSQVKLIAEPWDLGPGGYQVGNFPPQWTEWNGKYRDTVRDFWRGEPATLGEFASRLTGSADLYETSGRRPVASINFVIAHDGFTLNDLVSYNEKHNEANGENNNDGESHNRSWNSGAEGPDRRPEGARTCAIASAGTSWPRLLLSQGVPMIAHGDELGRTQRGNNNAYCQDSELTWINWEASGSRTDRVHRVAGPAAQAASHLPPPPLLRRPPGQPEARANRCPDIVWINPSGSVMAPEDWDSGFGRSVGVFLNGNGIRGMDRRGGRVVDDSFLLLFNAHDETLDFTVPSEEFAPGWTCVVDTAGMPDSAEATKAGEVIPVPAKGLVVLQALAESNLPVVHGAAAAVPAVPPVPVPTAQAFETEPVEQSVVPADASRLRSLHPPAPEPEAAPEPEPAPKPRRRRASTTTDGRPGSRLPSGRPTGRTSRNDLGSNGTAQASRRRPTGSRSPRRTDWTGPARWCPTWSDSGSTGPTSRRSWSPNRDRTMATTWSTTAGPIRPAGARPALAGFTQTAHAAGLGVLVDVVPEPCGCRHSGAFAVVVGCAGQRPGIRPTRTPSTSIGISATANSGYRSSVTETTSSTPCRSSAISCTTTITTFPSPQALSAVRRSRCTPVSTTS